MCLSNSSDAYVYMQTFCPLYSLLFCYSATAAVCSDEKDAFGRFRDGLRATRSNPIVRLYSLLYSRSSSLSDARNNNQVNSGDPRVAAAAAALVLFSLS